MNWVVWRRKGLGLMARTGTKKPSTWLGFLFAAKRTWPYGPPPQRSFLRTCLAHLGSPGFHSARLLDRLYSWAYISMQKEINSTILVFSSITEYYHRNPHYGKEIKKLRTNRSFLICGEKDLNLHGITSISPSS